MGAKGKYSQEMCVKAEKYMKEHGLKRIVASNLGISHDTFYQYVNNHPEFADAIKRGADAFIQDNIKKLREHGDKNWQSIAWLLERMYRDDFSLKTEVQHTGKVEVNHTVNENDPLEVQKELHQFYGSALPTGSSN